MKDVIEINGVEYIRKDTIQVNADDNYCIVRTYSAGIFAGNLVKRTGKEGTIENARRLWYWDGAASLSQLAMEGISKPQNCKFPVALEVTLTEIIEILPCTEKARISIGEVPEWKA